MNARRAARTLVAVAVAGAALAGCGGEKDKASATDSSKTAGAETHGFVPVTADPPYALETTGKYGGTLVWASLGDLSSFNALIVSDQTAVDVGQLVFDFLTRYDNQKWEVGPGLAHSWEHSEDGKTWTFHLRKGIKWSDGEPLTAKDVAFSFQTIFNPKIQNPNVDAFKIGTAPLPTVEAPDDLTVVFKCSTLDALFLIHAGSIPIFPAHLWAKTTEGDAPTFSSTNGVGEPTKVVGSGPYRVVEYVAGERIVLERNPWSWRTNKAGERLPYLDKLIVKIVKDMNTRTLQFKNGDLDMIEDIPAPDYAGFTAKEAEGWFTLHRLGISMNTTYVALNQHPGKDKDSGEPFVPPYKLKWFQDVRFRRAMSHAINRSNLVKQILDGKGAPIFTGTTKGNKQWYAETTKYDYDVAKADALLDEMDLAKRDADGFRTDADGHRVSIELMTNVENGVRIKVITQIKDDWRAVGVEGVVHPIDFNSVVAAQESNHKWEACMLGWGSAVPPDPLNEKNVYLSSGNGHVWYPEQPAPCNEFEKKSDEIFDKMSQELDEGKRKELFAQILQMHAEYQGFIWLYAQNGYCASKNRVKNMKASILHPETWWNFEELWVDDGK